MGGEAVDCPSLRPREAHHQSSTWGENSACGHRSWGSPRCPGAPPPHPGCNSCSVPPLEAPRTTSDLQRATWGRWSEGAQGVMRAAGTRASSGSLGVSLRKLWNLRPSRASHSLPHRDPKRCECAHFREVEMGAERDEADRLSAPWNKEKTQNSSPFPRVLSLSSHVLSGGSGDTAPAPSIDTAGQLRQGQCSPSWPPRLPTSLLPSPTPAHPSGGGPQCARGRSTDMSRSCPGLH